MRAAIAIGKLTSETLSSYSPKSKGSKFSAAGKDESRSIHSNAHSLTVSIRSKPLSSKDRAVLKGASKVDNLGNSVNDTPAE